jgi:hypothetical protein
MGDFLRSVCNALNSGDLTQVEYVTKGLTAQHNTMSNALGTVS